jgi:hypothetical protein
VGEDAQLDLVVVGGQQRMPAAATKQLRTGARSPMRIGMFWRFGFVLERRPVAVATWLKVVWSATGVGIDQVRQRVEVGVLELRQLAPALDLRDDLVLVADLGEHAASVENRSCPAASWSAELFEQAPRRAAAGNRS